MKKIEAIISTHMLEESKNALINIGINCLSITEIKSYDRQKAHEGYYRGSPYPVDLFTKAKIEIILEDDLVKTAIETIKKIKEKDPSSDDEIYSYSIHNMQRIRTQSLPKGSSRLTFAKEL